MDKDENGETSQNDDERPLKKARYAWQVKGKYHLKSSDSKSQDFMDLQPEPDEMCAVSESKATCHKKLNSSFKHTKRMCDSAYVDRILSRSEDLAAFPLHIDDISGTQSDDIPVSLVKPHPKNYDFYLKKWQARQVAKAFVDNIINRVLENWILGPWSEASDFIENYDNGGFVEDEGILMAIQSHGLQSGSRENGVHARETIRNQIGSTSDDEIRIKCDGGCNVPMFGRVPFDRCNCSHKRRVMSEVDNAAPKRVPFHRRDPTYEEPSYNLNVNAETEYSNRSSSDDVDTPATIEESGSGLERNDYAESKAVREIEEEKEEEDNYEHFDFLDAAVAVAIQKKGLTSFNCVG